ncbi:hypothetical protein GS16_05180 [Candidatus Liberibacter solanacearum]|nr:hypothetical protein GS16_05180 [Candidatus Liberibacter solanacearum]KJZ81408.1 hypothetical protein KP07_00465 [Candidatus Liberibacter solanacearum]KQC49041.1 hypothetical protein AP064_02975 [Candidatus Liberibacter solanacearum]
MLTCIIIIGYPYFIWQGIESELFDQKTIATLLVTILEYGKDIISSVLGFWFSDGVVKKEN